MEITDTDSSMNKMTMTDSWMETDATRSCPLCNDRQWSVISKRMQHGLNLTTVICDRCSFVFTNPLPFRENYENFYLETYYQYYGGISAQAAGVNLKEEPEHIRRKLDRIESFMSLDGKRLLEVGPGKGLFLWWARNRGSSVTGVDPSGTFHQLLTSLGLPCLNSSFTDMEVPDDGRFDIIVMNHVLEHFYDPVGALEQCNRLLKEDGLLIIEVPNILKPFRSLDRYFLRYVHTVNFSPLTLNAMLDKCGFKIKLKDEGGNGWTSPEHLFVIAGIAEPDSGNVHIFTWSAHEVKRHLRLYSFHWRLWVGPAWYMHDLYVRGRRILFRLLRLIIQKKK